MQFIFVLVSVSTNYQNLTEFCFNVVDGAMHNNGKRDLIKLNYDFQRMLCNEFNSISLSIIHLVSGDCIYFKRSTTSVQFTDLTMFLNA